jgi:hypothetical protein
MPRSLICFALNAVIDIGTAWAFSLRRSAVTTTVSTPLSVVCAAACAVTSKDAAQPIAANMREAFMNVPQADVNTE